MVTTTFRGGCGREWPSDRRGCVHAEKIVRARSSRGRGHAGATSSEGLRFSLTDLSCVVGDVFLTSVRVCTVYVHTYSHTRYSRSGASPSRLNSLVGTMKSSKWDRRPRGSGICDREGKDRDDVYGPKAFFDRDLWKVRDGRAQSSRRENTPNGVVHHLRVEEDRVDCCRRFVEVEERRNKRREEVRRYGRGAHH